ncbi:hypothetical protein [Halobacillus massiliensis]|uniref:hypothetical protein n=1 Tax=Halobacillus massiliensis TaxID=1926286 RepID=UPI0009E2D6C7|nr:hypothetical protein [Halobacillus massiliensis]
MNPGKHSFFILVNVSIGLTTCLVYLYTWMSLSIEKPLWLFGPLINLTFCMSVFVFYNFMVLRKEERKYWTQAIFSCLAAIFFFAFFLSR